MKGLGVPGVGYGIVFAEAKSALFVISNMTITAHFKNDGKLRGMNTITPGNKNLEANAQGRAGQSESE